MKKLYSFIGLLITSIVCIIILFLLDYGINTKFYHSLWRILSKVSLHWYFYTWVILLTFSAIFSLSGLIIIERLVRYEEKRGTVLLIAATPVLYPLFSLSLSLILGIHSKPENIIEFSVFEYIVTWILRIIYWIYIAIITISVLIVLPRKHTLHLIAMYILLVLYLLSEHIGFFQKISIWIKNIRF
jgi:hypothetical protein